MYGSVAANNKELVILSRSILEILIDLASFIIVPEAHVLSAGSGQRRRTGQALKGRSGP